MLLLDRSRKFGLQVISESEQVRYEFWEGTVKDLIILSGLFSCTPPSGIRQGRSKIDIRRLSARWDCLQCSLVSVSVQHPRHLPAHTRDVFLLTRNPSVHRELGDHVLARKTMNSLWRLRQVGKRGRGSSPDLTWLMQCLAPLENLLLCGKVLSYHLVIIVSLGVGNGKGGRKGI